MKKYFLLFLLSMITCQGASESTDTKIVADIVAIFKKKKNKEAIIENIEGLIKAEVKQIVNKVNCNFSPSSLLTLSVYGNCVELLNFLIENGVEINGKNKSALDRASAMKMRNFSQEARVRSIRKNYNMAAYNMANYETDNEAIISLLGGEDKEQTMKIWNSERKKIALGEEKNNGSPETETSSTLSNTNIFIIVVLVLAVLSFIVYLYSENSRSEAVKKLKKRK